MAKEIKLTLSADHPILGKKGRVFEVTSKEQADYFTRNKLAKLTDATETDDEPVKAAESKEVEIEADEVKAAPVKVAPAKGESKTKAKR